MDNNVYYSPEKFGLVILGTLDEPDLSYEYNTLVVFQRIKVGSMYWAHDSGCSCPTPFETYRFNGAEDTNLERLTRSSWNSFETTVKGFPVGHGERARLLELCKSSLM